MSLLIRHVHSLLFDRRSFWTLASLVILGDVLLTLLIVRFIPYTEIDWETYMIQIDIYLKGERDYSFISGPTGPLVYPGGHVLIHQLLSSIGNDIRTVQYVYVVLYVLTLATSIAIYYLAGAPNWLVLVLPLSKRLHSIYVLRLFNDCWAVLFMNISILAMQMKLDIFAAALFSLALSVKMNILLYAPAFVVIFAKRHGIVPSLPSVAVVAALQLIVAYPFRHYPREYLNGAFNFSRVFRYKWTVNWRMISEETFLSPQWKWSLLAGHIITLSIFVWRWMGGRKGVQSALWRISKPVGFGQHDNVALILFTSNLVGIIFSRSLHYQFYSWYAQQVPYLAWKTELHWSLKLLIVVGVEYAWNVFPSTPMSSACLCTANLTLLIGLW